MLNHRKAILIRTKAKDHSVVDAFYLSEKEEVSLPAQREISLNQIVKVKNISLLDRPGKLKWQYQGKTCAFSCPAGCKNSGLKQAATFKIDY